MLSPDHEEICIVQDHYQMKGFPLDQFLVRSIEGKNRSIYFVSTGVRQLIENPRNQTLKIVNTGIKAFGKSSLTGALNGEDSCVQNFCSLRLHAEILPFLMPFIDQARVFFITKDDLLVALSEEYPYFNKFSPPLAASLESATYGGCVFKYSSDQDSKQILHFSIWRARTSVNVLLNMQERESYLTRLFGHEFTLSVLAKRKKGLDRNERL